MTLFLHFTEISVLPRRHIQNLTEVAVEEGDIVVAHGEGDIDDRHI